MMAVLGMVALAGCATGISRQQVLQSLVGRPESDALRTLGAPNRTIQANGNRFLAYDERYVDYVPALPAYGPFGPFGFGYVGAPSLPVVRACETTLEVTAGRVASWTLRGNAC